MADVIHKIEIMMISIIGITGNCVPQKLNINTIFFHSRCKTNDSFIQKKPSAEDGSFFTMTMRSLTHQLKQLQLRPRHLFDESFAV